jgi:hypothetical protein
VRGGSVRISEFKRLVAEARETWSLPNGDEAMNVQRGAKRITLVVSVMAGLGTWVHSSTALFDHWYWEREQYLAYREKYENIKWFWETWDADAWTRDGNRMAKNDVLHALLDSPWRGMPFTRGDIFDQINPEPGSRTDFTLSGCDVMPGIDATMLDLPAAALPEAVQKAREKGLWKALANCRSEETFWTKRIQLQLLVFSIVFGLLPSTGAFIVVWLLFFLFRWISRGFVTAAGQAPKVGELNDPMLSPPKEPSGGTEYKSPVCNTQENAAEADKQPMIIG